MGNTFNKSGDTLKATDMYNKSIEYLSKSVDLDSASVKTYMNRATTFIFMKKYDLAAIDFEKTLELEPNNIDMMEKRAYAYNMSGQWEKAILDYDKLISINADNSFLYLNRGNAKYNMEIYKDAIDDFKILVRFQPQNGNAYYLLALSYSRIGDHVNALANKEKAKQLGYPVNEKDLEKLH